MQVEVKMLAHFPAATWLQLVLLAALQLPEQLPVAPKFAELP